MAGKEFIGYAAQGILVAQLAPADGTLKLFWRQVRVCTALIIGLSLNCGQAEIGEQRFTAGIVEDMFRFELAMNNLLLVGIVKRLPNLGADRQSFLLRQRIGRLAVDTIAQSDGRKEVLCHQQRVACCYARVKHGKYKRMPEPDKGVSFLEK